MDELGDFQKENCAPSVGSQITVVIAIIRNSVTEMLRFLYAIIWKGELKENEMRLL
jgi:hypothetical protein